MRGVGRPVHSRCPQATEVFGQAGASSRRGGRASPCARADPAGSAGTYAAGREPCSPELCRFAAGGAWPSGGAGTASAAALLPIRSPLPPPGGDCGASSSRKGCPQAGTGCSPVPGIGGRSEDGPAASSRLRPRRVAATTTRSPAWSTYPGCSRHSNSPAPVEGHGRQILSALVLRSGVESDDPPRLRPERLRDRTALQQGVVAYIHGGEHQHPAAHRDGAEHLPAHHRPGEGRRRQRRDAAAAGLRGGIGVAQRAVDRGRERVVEQPHHDAQFGLDLAGVERGLQVDAVGAGEGEQRAAALDLGLGEDAVRP